MAYEWNIFRRLFVILLCKRQRFGQENGKKKSITQLYDYDELSSVSPSLPFLDDSAKIIQFEIIWISLKLKKNHIQKITRNKQNFLLLSESEDVDFREAESSEFRIRVGLQNIDYAQITAKITWMKKLSEFICLFFLLISLSQPLLLHDSTIARSSFFGKFLLLLLIFFSVSCYCSDCCWVSSMAHKLI